MPEFFDIACNLTHESILPNIDDVISEASLITSSIFGKIDSCVKLHAISKNSGI